MLEINRLAEKLLLVMEKSYMKIVCLVVIKIFLPVSIGNNVYLVQIKQICIRFPTFQY